MFNGLVSLKSINLQDNHLMTLPINTFGGLPNLQNLDLSKNYIQIRFGTFWRVDNLQKLDLSSNKLQEIDFDKLMDLINLRELIIDNNDINALNIVYLGSKLPHLTKLSLGQNTWQCKYLAHLIILLRQIDIQPVTKFELKEGDFKSAIKGISCFDPETVEW